VKRLAVFSLLAVPACAHVMSMSSGDLTIKGNHAHYDLRMPLYEITHIRNPQQALFEHIHFSSAGRTARLLDHSCREDVPQDSYLCAAEYEFDGPVETLDVDCTFPAITVPNHVHLLRVENDGKRDQGLFDISFTTATLRFRPPSAFETAAAQTGAGFMRALGGPVQVLFLAGLVLAARTRRELILLSAMFLGGEILSALVVSHTQWQPPPRFVEAASALTLAYLAVEILTLPHAGMRWLVMAVLGGFHGLYFALFLRTSGYRSVYVLAGAGFGEILAIAMFGLLFSRLSRRLAAWKPVPVSASVMLLIGIVWFFLRLRS
jgi:hypothetical protein